MNTFADHYCVRRLKPTSSQPSTHLVRIVALESALGQHGARAGVHIGLFQLLVHYFLLADMSLVKIASRPGDGIGHLQMH